MTETIRGIATRVDIARTYAPDIPVDLLTRADRAVANTLAPHGLAAGAVGHFIARRGDIDGQAAIVGAPSSLTWTCEGLNTSRYRQFPLGLVFRPVESWTPILEATAFTYAEPARTPYDATHIDMLRQRMRYGSPQALTASFSAAPQTRLGDSMALLQEIADRSGSATFRVVMHDGAVLVFHGEPGNAPGVDVRVAGLATGSFEVLIHGTVIRQRDAPAVTYVEIQVGAAVVELELQP
jgi:hypothetical protein